MDINDRLKEVVERSERSSTKLDLFVNGDKNAIVKGDKGDYPSLLKISADAEANYTKLDSSVASATASKNAAKTSETNAKASETKSKASQTASNVSQVASKASENKARAWASNPKGTAVEPGKYSALHQATVAKEQAVISTSSAAASKASQSASKASQTASKTSETNALNYKNAANTAKTGADAAKKASEVARDSSKSWATSDTPPATGLKSSKVYATEAKTSAAGAVTAKNASVVAQRASEDARNKSKASQTASSNTATASAASAVKAKAYAENDEGKAVEAGKYSAKHWAAKSSTSASSSSTSAIASAASAKTSSDKSNLSGASAQNSEKERKASEAAKTASVSAKNDSVTAMNKSKEWATRNDGKPVEGTLYSAKKYATDAAGSANSAKASQSASKASQTASKTSETNAGKSNAAATVANTAAQKAKTDAQAANTAAQKAKTDAQNALKNKFDKSGGKITGVTTVDSSDPTPLHVRRNSSDSNISISFQGKTLPPKYFGLGASGKLKFGDTQDINGQGFDIYHEGRKPTYAEIASKPAITLSNTSIGRMVSGKQGFQLEYGSTETQTYRFESDYWRLYAGSSKIVSTAATAVREVLKVKYDGTVYSHGKIVIDGAGRVPWAVLKDVPAVASRWPSWGEVTGKPGVISFVKNLATTDKLNNIIITGWYDNPSNATASTTNNYPTGQAGWLEVWNNSASQVYQRYQTYSPSNQVWTRNRYNNAWSSWARLAKSGESYTKAQGDARFINKSSEAKYFLKTGGTLTGNVSVSTAGEGIFRVDAGTNKNVSLYLTEDNRNHGAYIRYQGLDNNATYFGTRNGNVDIPFMSIPRGTNAPTFVGTPKVGSNAIYHKGNKPTWADVGGNSYIKTTDSSHLQIASGKWIRAASDSTGFIPSKAATGASSQSFIGTSSWWFKETWANTHKGGNVDVTSNVSGKVVKAKSSASTYGLQINGAGTYSELVPITKDGVEQWSYALRWYGGKDWRFGGSKAYHEGHMPTPAEIGALATTGKATNSGKSDYLTGFYVGGGKELPNYFGAGRGKLQMLTTPSWGWADTLWLSSYSGSDVKLSNQLVISKVGKSIGFRQQNYDSKTWGAINEIYHTGHKPTYADVGALAAGGKAVDADKVDGIQGASLMRSDADDTFTGKIISGNRGNGFYGVYDSKKTQNIWSMGTAYPGDPAGTNFGKSYGFGYKHTTNTFGGTMAGGHQIVFTENGNPGCSIGLAGGFWSRQNITAYSDIRVKTNIEKIPNALEKVMSLGGYTFDRTDVQDEDGKPFRQTGVIAQEVQKVLPEAVTGGITDDDHLSVAYGNMIGLLIEAIKEQQIQIEALKNGNTNRENISK
ncbi:tail fiber domain-containing protein [Shewanella sp. KX20019]|uniref:tail fiber domain-containing protein n=1 Tax=Shewanella sp. KX20019 TaxID=2803864 RepID=UPI0019278258|nr:tail fiber domain-containing protein [Shewanella sp. KX20019]QQX80864.1 tail fiber domain-containing protein [Shewanella sp. KX20019]